LASWENSGYVDASDDVVIFGAGPTGLSALVVAKTANAHVITIDPLKFQHEIARKFDADETIDPTHGDLKDKIMGLTGWRGSSLVVEASGKDKAIASIFDIAGNGVRVRLIGHSIARKVPVEIGWTIWKTLVITGSGGTRNFAQRGTIARKASILHSLFLEVQHNLHDWISAIPSPIATLFPTCIFGVDLSPRILRHNAMYIPCALKGAPVDKTLQGVLHAEQRVEERPPSNDTDHSFGAMERFLLHPGADRFHRDQRGGRRHLQSRHCPWSAEEGNAPVEGQDPRPHPRDVRRERRPGRLAAGGGDVD
jgi:hypothetical protein